MILACASPSQMVCYVHIRRINFSIFVGPKLGGKLTIYIVVDRYAQAYIYSTCCNNNYADVYD